MKKLVGPDPLTPRPNLDFSKGVRGKYINRMQEGTNIVLVAPDLPETFPDSELVNEALRSLKKIATRTHSRTVGEGVWDQGLGGLVEVQLTRPLSRTPHK